MSDTSDFVKFQDSIQTIAVLWERYEVLKRENADIRAAVDGSRSLIKALQDENAALRADAERYRFIRSFDAWGIFDHKRGEALDLAIDFLVERKTRRSC